MFLQNPISHRLCDRPMRQSWTPIINSVSVGTLYVIFFNVVVLITYEAAAPLGDRGVLLSTVAAGSSGDSIRQILYISIFFLSLLLGSCALGYRMFQALSLPYNIACVWCLASCIWAIEPGISIRRSIGMYVVLQATCIIIQIIGVANTLLVVRRFLMFLIIGSLVSVAFSKISVFAFAVHPIGEADPSLVGAWRGLMPHKNVAGAIMTHATVVFLHFALNGRRKIDWLFFFLALVFLVGTKSKTSIALDGFILLFGLTYRYFMSRMGGRHAFLTLIGAGVFAAAVMVVVEWDDIYRFFTNPLNLSGRVAIWQSLLTYIERHIWLGSGYGSFWAIGDSSPIYPIATTDFIKDIGHSHSGYFEILLTTGVIGLTLAIVALVIWPAYKLLSADPQKATLFAMCFSVWLFGILQNLTESQFFSPDKQSWIFVVVAICLIKNYTPSLSRTTCRSKHLS